MQYVKLIAKPDTWFKAGTEVYSYDYDWENRKRITLEEWKEWEKSGMYCARGTWVAQKGYGAVENCGYEEGKEYFDGECGSIDEFEVEIVDSER